MGDVPNGLLIIDISDLSAPTPARQYNTAGRGRVVTVSGDYVYVGDGNNGLVILRVGTSDTQQIGDLNHDNQIPPPTPRVVLEFGDAVPHSSSR